MERIAEREARRLGERAGGITAKQLDALQRQVAELGAQLGHSGSDARDAGYEFARSARHIAGSAAQEFGHLARHEGAVVARQAAKQALRAGRAVKADPMPALAALIGGAMIARLLAPSRRSATRS
ncbi:MAG TPA: hypothetical protein VG757_04465 [Devosia sp.]|nr:hypothetical protein [Devosia sp.]